MSILLAPEFPVCHGRCSLVLLLWLELSSQSLSWYFPRQNNHLSLVISPIWGSPHFLKYLFSGKSQTGISSEHLVQQSNYFKPSEIHASLHRRSHNLKNPSSKPTGVFFLLSSVVPMSEQEMVTSLIDIHTVLYALLPNQNPPKTPHHQHSNTNNTTKPNHNFHFLHPKNFTSESHNCTTQPEDVSPRNTTFVSVVVLRANTHATAFHFVTLLYLHFGPTPTKILTLHTNSIILSPTFHNVLPHSIILWPIP